MKTILRVVVVAAALAAPTTAQATTTTGPTACATSYYPVDFATQLEYSGSRESASPGDSCQRFIQPGY